MCFRALFGLNLLDIFGLLYGNLGLLGNSQKVSVDVRPFPTYFRLLRSSIKNYGQFSDDFKVF